MNTTPEALTIAWRINRVRDEKTANPGEIERLMSEADSDHLRSDMLPIGESQGFASAVGAISSEALGLGSKRKGLEETRGETVDKRGPGKPEEEGTFVYTYSVGRVR